jgi:hypothetical protein
MKSNDIILHMVTGNLKIIADLQRRLSQLNENKETSSDIKEAEKIRLSTETIQHLAVIEPALNLAIKEMPEFKVWLTSAQDALIRIKADGGIIGNICECRGCKPTGCKVDA